MIRLRVRLPKEELPTRAARREAKRKRKVGVTGRSVFVLGRLLRRGIAGPQGFKRIPRRGKEVR